MSLGKIYRHRFGVFITKSEEANTGWVTKSAYCQLKTTVLLKFCSNKRILENSKVLLIRNERIFLRISTMIQILLKN